MKSYIVMAVLTAAALAFDATEAEAVIHGQHYEDDAEAICTQNTQCTVKARPLPNNVVVLVTHISCAIYFTAQNITVIAGSADTFVLRGVYPSVSQPVAIPKDGARKHTQINTTTNFLTGDRYGQPVLTAYFDGLGDSKVSCFFAGDVLGR